MNQIFSFYLLLFPTLLFAQKVETKFVIGRGKFIFDKESYLIQKKKAFEAIKSQRKSDSINSLNNGTSSTFISCGIADYPKFDSITGKFKHKLIENVKISPKTKFGENIFCLVLDKKGKILKFYSEKTADKKVFRQVKNMVLSKEYDKWQPADFYGVKVGYIFKFKLIIAKNFENYSLKNEWARSNDSNYNEFKNT